jgi:hypothetical protein
MGIGIFRLAGCCLCSLLTCMALAPSARAQAAPPLTDDQLAALKAVPAWDIQFTRVFTLDVSGNGTLTDLAIDSYAISERRTFIYTVTLTVAGGDCMISNLFNRPLPCAPVFTAPGSVTVDVNERRVRRQTVTNASTGTCVDAGGRAVPFTQIDERNSIGGTGSLPLDGTPGAAPSGDGFAFYSGVNPPSAVSVLAVEPSFPGQLEIRQSTDCARSPFDRLDRFPVTTSPNGSAFVHFGPSIAPIGGLEQTSVRIENGRFVVRASAQLSEPAFLCLDPFDPGLCDRTLATGLRTDRMEVVVREHGAPSPPTIDSVEFTQSIQILQRLRLLKADLDRTGRPPVPIAAGKPMAMRVYVQPDSDGTATTPVPITLDVGGVINESRPWRVDPACETVHKRLQHSDCFAIDFYFTPPEGEWTVTLSLKDRTGTEVETHALTINSDRSDAMVLDAVSVCDEVDASGAWLCGKAADLAGLLGQLRNIAPTHSVGAALAGHQLSGSRAMAGDLDGDGATDSCVDAAGNAVTGLSERCESDAWWFGTLDVLRDLHRLEQSVPLPGRQTYYYGMARPEVVGFIGGIAELPGHAAMSRTSVLRFGAEFNFETVAHETGHMLGLQHTNTGVPSTVAAPGCYNLAQDSSTDWRYPDNRLWSDGGVEIGFDLMTHAPVDPLKTFETLSYCVPRWISPRTAIGMARMLQSAAAPAAAGIPGSFELVRGAIEEGSTHLQPIFTVEATAPLAAGEGSHRIDVEDDEGRILFSRLFTPTRSATEVGPGGQDVQRPSTFSELVSVLPGSARLTVRTAEGTTVAEVVLGGAAPVVTIDTPRADERLEGARLVTWTAIDADSVRHTFLVQYSADAGATWRVLASSLTEPSLIVNFDTLAGSSGRSLIRVLASDGVNTGVGVSPAFSVGRKLPVASIVFPGADLSFPLKTLVWLQAAASDVDDGVLSGSAVEWMSDVTGLLGHGESLPLYDLPLGQHTITLSVTDSDGNVATHSVTISIGPARAGDRDAGGSPGGDTTPPTIRAILSEPPNAEGWHATAVHVSWDVGDEQSGIVASTGCEPVTVRDTSGTTLTCTAVNGVGLEASATATLKVDLDPPSIECDASDGVWHATNVAVNCTAVDAISGLANPSDAAFALTTAVAEGVEASDAPTRIHPVCDRAGHCNTAGPVSAFHIDRRPPDIAVSAAAGPFLVGQAASLEFSCADAGSGVASCLPSFGTRIDTSRAGTFEYTITALDHVGNRATRSGEYDVRWAVRLLGGPLRMVRAGATLPVKAMIVDADGVNRSSPDIVLMAQSAQDAGLSNPEGRFRFDASLDGYIFNLSTKALSPGSHRLRLRIGGQGGYAITFEVR